MNSKSGLFYEKNYRYTHSCNCIFFSVTASQSLHKYLWDTISWKQDKAKKVEIKVYDQKDEFDYSLSTTSRIYLDQSESILLINLEYGVYGFALFLDERRGVYCL